MTVLSVTGVHVQLGSKSVLAGINADFAPGQVTCIVGPNGAGKSTLLTVLAGLRKPDRGAVVFDGIKIDSMAPRERAQRMAEFACVKSAGRLHPVRPLLWAAGVVRNAGKGGNSHSVDPRKHRLRGLDCGLWSVPAI